MSKFVEKPGALTSTWRELYFLNYRAKLYEQPAFNTAEYVMNTLNTIKLDDLMLKNGVIPQ